MPGPNPPARATLVVGSEDLLVDRAIASIVRAARRLDAATTRVDVEAAGVDADADFAGALEPTLFGDASVVVLRSAEAADPDLVASIDRAIADLPDPITLVLVHAGAAKGRGLLDRWRKLGVEVLTCEKVKGRGFDDFLVREFRHHHRAVTTEAVAVLRAALGDDLRGLAAACAQLVSDIETDPPDAPIGADDVRTYYGGVATVKGWDVADAVWDARPLDVLVKLRWLLEGGPRMHPVVVAWVVGGLRSLLRLAGAPPGMSEADLAREVGVPPFRIRTLRQQLQRWRPEQLAEAFRLLVAVDAAVKGGEDNQTLDEVQKDLVLERTLLTIARSRGR